MTRREVAVSILWGQLIASLTMEPVPPELLVESGALSLEYWRLVTKKSLITMGNEM